MRAHNFPSRYWRVLVSLPLLGTLVKLSALGAKKFTVDALHGAAEVERELSLEFQNVISKSACFLTCMQIGDPGTGYLGNQIFQVASMIGLAERFGWSWKFPSKINSTRVGLLFQFVGEYIDPNTVRAYKEKSLSYYEVDLGECNGGGISLEGYFQSPNYFSNSIQTLQRVLTVDRRFLKRIADAVPAVKAQNSVTVHVRRGDYTQLAHIYSLPSVEYYRRALSKIKYIDTVIIVSNDVDWCKKNIEPGLPYKILYSPFTDELSDFVLLLLGKHSILANSSFSWWSAYLKSFLRGRSQGQVVAPRPWYNPSGVNSYVNNASFYPSSWIVMDI